MGDDSEQFSVELPEFARRDELRPFIPLLYVAWSDGDLTRDEVAHVRSFLDEYENLDPEASESIRNWLDPDDPPSPRQLKALLRPIREACGELSSEKRRSLVDLGVQMAESEAEGISPDELEDSGLLKALNELQEALGVHGYEAAEELLGSSRERTKAPVEEPDPEFDVDDVVQFLDGEYREINERVRDLLGRSEFEYVSDVTKSEYRAQVTEWLGILADEGLGKIPYPESVGGEGNMGRYIGAFETLAAFDLSLLIKFGVQFGLFGGSIRFLGEERHHEEYLEDVGDLELPGGFAMTEKGHGSNVRNLETVARYDTNAGEFVVTTPSESAHKEYIGNAARDGQVVTVFAQLETDGESYGVHPFLVRIRDEDGNPVENVRIEDSGHKMGLNGVDNGRIWFDDVRISRENMLTRYGEVDADGAYSSPIPSDTKRFFTMIGTLVGGRVAVASASVTSMKSALTIATRYGARRRQFGPSGEPEQAVLDYRSHKRRLIPRIAEAYGLHFATRHLRERYRNKTEEDEREVEALAAGLKAYSSWRGVDAIQESREACGGEGYMTDNRISEIRKDVDIFTTFEGDNTVLMMLVARGLLDNFRKQFEDNKFFGILSYVADQARTTITELNPVTTRKTDPEHLRGEEFQRSAFEYREKQLLRTSAQRIKKRIDDGMEPFDAFSEVQDHLLSLATAHVERTVLQQFLEAEETCGDEDFLPWLRSLRQLFALDRIHDDVGWFLENGYLEPAKSKAVRSQVNELCDEIRPQAVHLVDAFGIPKSCLDAPIAFGEETLVPE